MTIEHKLRELVDLWRRRVGPVFCVGFTGTGLCAQELESILNEASIQTEGDTVNRALAAYNEHMADESHGKPCQYVAMRRALSAAPAVVDDLAWPVLTETARVGATVFCKGVSTKLVVDRAIREVEYQSDWKLSEADKAALTAALRKGA